MLKDYLPIAGILLFVYFWIEDSWAQVVMDFVNTYLGDFIEVINDFTPYVLFLVFFRVFLIPKINSFIFDVWFNLMYKRFNELISVGEDREVCESFKSELSDIKIQLNKKIPLKNLSTTFSMIYTAVNTTQSSVKKK